jgi:DNA end-binding protein Ku
MRSSAWEGVVSFDLLSIPIRPYPAAGPLHINLHQLHTICKTRLQQPPYCPHCERMVERNEVVKRYEEKDGRYVLVDPEELRKISPKSTRVTDILSFTKQSELDPVFFDASYFIVPEKEGRKAYQLAKRKGSKVSVESHTRHAPVIDMMSALKKSLETTGAHQRKPSRATTANYCRFAH